MFSLAVPATFVSIEATSPHRHQHTSDQIRVTYVLILNVSPKSQHVPSETHILLHHPQYWVLHKFCSILVVQPACSTSCWSIARKLESAKSITHKTKYFLKKKPDCKLLIVCIFEVLLFVKMFGIKNSLCLSSSSDEIISFQRSRNSHRFKALLNF